MKTKLFLTITLLMSFTAIHSQTLGDFKPGKSGPSSLEKRKFESKNVYIADFAVHYQVYAEESTTNKGGTGLVRGTMGKTKAAIAVGLDLPASTLQSITDRAYNNFVEDLKAKGFTILPADAAKITNYYAKYSYSNHLQMMPSTTMEGGIAVHPQNVGFYYKEKGPYASYAKLSSELNDAAVIRVDIYVQFVETISFNKGFGASVNAKTNLVVSDKNTIAHFIVGRNKIGGSPLAEYQGVLKKEWDINGVIREEKISASVQADYDNIGTQTAFATVYSAKNKTSAKTAMVSTDAAKYEKGVTQAITTFLNYHLGEFQRKHY